MTTIIRLNNANFSNSNLPVLPRIVPNATFGFKPSIKNGIVDFAGSASIDSIVGTPTLTDTGVNVTYENNYFTDVADDSDYFTVCGVISGIDDDPTASPIGNLSTTDSAGFYVWVRSGTMRALCYDASSSSQQITFSDVYNSEGTFFALVCDESGLTLYQGVSGVLTSQAISATFADRPKSTYNINIGDGTIDTDATQGGAIDINEVSMHKFALTQAQVESMYEYARVYQSAINGISI